jgi:hypothetical protein
MILAALPREAYASNVRVRTPSSSERDPRQPPDSEDRQTGLSGSRQHCQKRPTICQNKPIKEAYGHNFGNLFVCILQI